MAAPAEALTFGAKDWTARKVKIKGTTFHFKKMLAMEGFRVFETLRPGIAEAMGKVPANADLGTMLSAGIFAVPPKTIEDSMAHLFGHIEYTNAKTKTPVKVGGMEDGGAFEGLEPVHVYEVMVRAFAVNFTESWDEIKSRMPSGLISAPPDTSTSPDS